MSLSLTYLAAMRFKSIPVFWCSQNLADPQSLNAYSYANNNPITLSDPRGKFFETAFDLAMLGYSLYQLYEHPSWENAGAAGLDALGTVIPFVRAGGGLLVRTTKTAKKLADGAETSGKTYQIYGKVSTKADEVYIDVLS